jgi:hypothetical protein
MPSPIQTPIQTPVVSPETMPAPSPELYPDEICHQQKREGASPDVSP